jgi:hypothetical protein
MLKRRIAVVAERRHSWLFLVVTMTTLLLLNLKYRSYRYAYYQQQPRRMTSFHPPLLVFGTAV